MNITLFGAPLFKYISIKTKDYRGVKIVFFGILLLTLGIGYQEGYHHHMSFGILNTEIFLGFTLKDKTMP
tara:strand:+ start:5758 stop:5967 length:210 start_codon:yes stop_codon:yes gene_type:complete